MRIGEHDFATVSYDVDADVLYLSAGEPAVAARWQETAEGHAVRFDREDRVIGVTVVRPAGLLGRDGTVELTLPAVRLTAEDLRGALSVSAGAVSA